MQIALDRPQNYRSVQLTHGVSHAAQVQARPQEQARAESKDQDRARLDDLARVEAQGWRKAEPSQARSTSLQPAGLQEQKPSNVGFAWPHTASQTITETIAERNSRYIEEAIKSYTEQNAILEGWQFKALDLSANELGRFSVNSQVSTAAGGALAGIGSVIDMRV